MILIQTFQQNTNQTLSDSYSRFLLSKWSMCAFTSAASNIALWYHNGQPQFTFLNLMNQKKHPLLLFENIFQWKLTSLIEFPTSSKAWRIYLKDLALESIKRLANRRLNFAWHQQRGNKVVNKKKPYQIIMPFCIQLKQIVNIIFRGYINVK